MKMRKYLYIAAVAALSLTACSNTEDQLFDDSAAVRLDKLKSSYSELLSSNGGLWTFEYFANDESQGYLFVVRFGTDNKVDFYANHKWIGNTLKEESSHWTMIADNGPVLSFNSYNDLFHIFSDPMNITGEFAPSTGDGSNERDIDETGLGHEGDYEFQVMHVSDDGNTVRLLGKKRMIDAYLHRLDPSTDPQTYMNDYKAVESNLFTSKIPTLKFRDADGENYIVNVSFFKNVYNGIMEFCPEGDRDVEKTTSGNFIVTKEGLRFMEPLTIFNAAGVEKTISEFKFVNNYSLALVDNENAILNAGTFVEMNELNHPNWKVDLKNLTGDVKNALDTFNDQLKTLFNYKSAAVQDMSFAYNTSSDSYTVNLTIKYSSKNTENDKFYVTFTETDNGLKFSLNGPVSNNDQMALNAYSELQNLFKLLSDSNIIYTYSSDCGPSAVTFDLGNGSMVLNVQ